MSGRRGPIAGVMLHIGQAGDLLNRRIVTSLLFSLNPPEGAADTIRQAASGPRIASVIFGRNLMKFWHATRKVMTRLAGSPSNHGVRMRQLETWQEDGRAMALYRVGGRGFEVDLQLRPGTTDMDLPGMILGDEGMYDLPEVVRPEVIFDVGGNIGIASVYFALRYPQATVYAFEPLPENLELLRRNTRDFANIHVQPYGLSNRKGTFTYCMSDNPASFGGGTFCSVGHNPQRSVELPLRTPAQVMDELGLRYVDVMKIDTEGSEFPVIEAMAGEIVQNVQAYVGELHGVDDWAFCGRLAPSHLVGVQKHYSVRCFPFMALRRDLAGLQGQRMAA